MRRPDRARPRPSPRGSASGRASRSRGRAGRPGRRPPSYRGRAPCRRSAAPARPAPRTRSSPRCGRAWSTTRSCSPSTSITSPSASGSALRRYAGSRARTAQPLRVANSTGDLGVVEVVVRQQHQRDVAGRARRARRGGRRRSGPGRRRPTGRHRARASTQVLVPSSVMMPGVRREQAARPLAERPAGPGAHASCRGERPATAAGRSGDRQRPALAQRLDAGGEHLDGPAVRRVERPSAGAGELRRPRGEVRYVGGSISISPRSAIATRLARPAARPPRTDSVDTSRVRCPSGSRATKNQVR